MNGDLTFSVNNQCLCIINDHIFRDVQAVKWPNFQLTTTFECNFLKKGMTKRQNKSKKQ